MSAELRGLYFESLFFWGIGMDIFRRDMFWGRGRFFFLGRRVIWVGFFYSGRDTV